MEISLEESTTENVSPTLERFIKSVSSSHKAPDSIQKDYLLILIIVSMIENEFLLVHDDYEVLNETLINAEQIARWKSPTGVYEVTLILNGYKGIPVRLIMSPLGAMALVNVVIKDFEAETYSVCLPMSKYVVSPQAATIPKIFRDLKHFSMIFKSKVLSAVKSRILGYYGFVSASLVGLPEELLFKILLNLPVSATVNVSRTCTSLRDVLQSQTFWHDMVKRDFKANSLHTNGEQDWKEVYKAVYIDQKDKQMGSRRGSGTMHDHMDYADYVSYIDNPLWNGLL